MKILHITAVRTGSTGRTATDLKTFLTQNGNEYKIAFSESDNRPLDGDILIGSRRDHKIHALLSRLFGLQGYFSFWATIKFLKAVKAYQPDIVQLGNLHANYINLPLLFRFLSKKHIPVVIILHDCWFFTGKCTHFTARGCEKWKTQCHNCPAKKTDNGSWFFDWSKKMFNDRRRWFESLTSLTVVAVSDWEMNLAKQSPVFGKANITRVYNWIDTDTFRPVSENQIAVIRKKYNLSPKIRYVISVSAGWVSMRSKTKDAITFAEHLPEGYKLLIVGRSASDVFPECVVRIPYTSTPQELAALYAFSEAYIHFSVEDTFGKVIAEAMACGTVPIVFDSTACGETASPYGIVVEAHDVSAMIDAIPLACEQQRKESVRQYALENYNRQKNIETYYEVYKSLIQSSKQKTKI